MLHFEQKSFILTLVFRKVRVWDLCYSLFMHRTFLKLLKNIFQLRIVSHMIRNFTFKPDDTTCQNDVINAMSKCVDDLRNSMLTDKLMINDDNTEFLLIGTRQQLAKINTACIITVGEYEH